MKVYEPNMLKKEIFLVLSNSGGGVDLDVVDSNGMYVTTFLSLKNGYLRLGKNLKNILEDENFDTSGLYYNADGSVQMEIE